MDVSIIIVNYWSCEKTRKCLLSLRDADFSGISHEIIVVDNSEDDDFPPSFREEYPEVKFILGVGNIGMGGGNNVGFQEASGEFALILNPDTIVRPDAIGILFEFMRDRHDVGIVGPKLLNQDGTLQYSCLRFPRFCTPIFRRTFLGRFAMKHLSWYLMTDFDHGSIRDVDWMIGSCLMIRSEFFRKVSGFDEKFFMYFEDTDLCRRTWRNGYRVVYHPSATVIHDHARGSAAKRWYIAPFASRLAREHIRSWLYYSWKWRLK